MTVSGPASTEWKLEQLDKSLEQLRDELRAYADLDEFCLAELKDPAASDARRSVFRKARVDALGKAGTWATRIADLERRRDMLRHRVELVPEPELGPADFKEAQVKEEAFGES